MKTYRSICPALFVVIMMFGEGLSHGQTTEARPCPQIVGTLVTQFTFRVPLSELPRVEIRQCGGNAETLQIVAWEARTQAPSLMIDTTDFTVVQSAARKNVFIIETTGGPRDRIYVIVFRDGKPKLELMRVTKGTAKITLDERLVELTVSGIYAGDAMPRTETHRYELEGWK